MQIIGLDLYTLSLIIITTFLTAGFLLYIFRKKEPLAILPLLATIIIVALLYRIIGNPGASYYSLLALDVCIAVISTILAVFYISKPYIFIGLVVLLVAAVLIYANNYPSNTGFAGMFGIGTICGLFYREFVLSPKKEKKKRRDKDEIRMERDRDIVQIVMGIAILGIAYFLSSYLLIVSAILMLILLGYTANNLLANLRLGSFYRRIRDLERKDVTFGLGATYLAAGTALLMGFTGNMHVFLFGIASLFFADPLATIIGISTRGASPLPYNRHKTIIGSFTFFIIAGIAGYYFLGVYGILMALVLAFIESLNLSIDDNVRIGAAVVILAAILGF